MFWSAFFRYFPAFGQNTERYGAAAHRLILYIYRYVYICIIYICIYILYLIYKLVIISSPQSFPIKCPNGLLFIMWPKIDLWQVNFMFLTPMMKPLQMATSKMDLFLEWPIKMLRTVLLNIFCWVTASIVDKCKHKTSMFSYITVLSYGLLLFNLLRRVGSPLP